MIIFLILLLVIIVLAYYCEHTMYHPLKNTEEHEFETLPKWGHDVKPFYDSVEHKPFKLDVPNGYTLNCEIVPADKNIVFPDGRQRTVILVHGRTANHITMYSHGEAYYKLGFNLVLYDQRAHGKSGGDICSMGYHEAEDLIYLAHEVKKMFPEDCIIGIHGESMGAAAVMLAAPSIPWLSFAAEDAGYASLRKEMNDSLMFKAKLLPIPFGCTASLISDIKEDFKLKDVMPIEAVKKTNCPMLFIHGGLDKFVPTSNVYMLYDAKPQDKMIKVFEDVPHAKSALMHQDEYKETLSQFLKHFSLI